MASFLYGIAGDQRPVTPERVKAWGLSYAFTGGIDHRQVNCGPWGSAGAVFCDTTRQGGRTAGYHPEQQTWRKLPTVEGRLELWVGYWNEAKPGPEDLRRAQLIRGPKIQLADGNAWQIPIVRHFDDSLQRWQSELPAYFDYDEAGKIIKGEPRDEYAYLWDATAPLADQLLDGQSLDDQEVFRSVEALLQANYVVALPELMVLRVLADDELIASICMVATRYKTFVEWCDSAKKKKSLETTSGDLTSAGKAG